MPPSFPRGIPYIIGNEAAERFSYYGMRAILVVFMTTYLRDSAGNLAVLPETEATAWYHLFGTANYLFPLFGALIADIWWGKYRTIISLSLVYCLGHAILAFDHTRIGLLLGLSTIAIGAGGIKPCVSAHLGDQFTEKTASLVSSAFALFYLAINLGACVSMFLTPWLLDRYGAGTAFGVPGILMAIATVLFWAGRNVFTAVPPVGWPRYREELFSIGNRRRLIRVGTVYIFLAVFWSLFEQTGSSWTLQAAHLDRRIDLSFGLTPLSDLRFELYPSQLQTLNPILVLILVPLVSNLLYPLLARRMELTSVRKIALGMVVTALSFIVIAAAQYRLEQGLAPSMGWQVFAYVLLTTGEVMVSITALEFAYTQAPQPLKSLYTSFYLLAVSLGNALTASVNAAASLIGTSQGPAYFLLFAMLMALAAAGLSLVTRRHFEERHLVS